MQLLHLAGGGAVCPAFILSGGSRFEFITIATLATAPLFALMSKCFRIADLTAIRKGIKVVKSAIGSAMLVERRFRNHLCV
jgi:hypothetical protein